MMKINIRDDLRSDSWQRLLRLVLDRCRGECEARLEGCTGVATQLYRRTSQHFGLEPLWNFSGVCDHCDQALREAGGEYIDWGPCQVYDSTLTTIAAWSEAEVHHEN